MKYRIELKMTDSQYNFTDKTEYVNGITELKTFLKECIEDDYIVFKIVKTYKDGRGIEVTDKYNNYLISLTNKAVS